MLLVLALACHGTPKHAIGAPEGLLAPCPDSPNCVSTQADPVDAEHYIAPIAVTGDPRAVLTQARTIVEALPRTQVVDTSSRYMHATFTSALWRFVDDVELVVDPDAGLLHFRSASRVGHSDLGVNRKRMEAFRAAWEQEAAAP